MNSEQFSEALENISEPLIDNAARAYDTAAQKRRRNQRIFRTACAAVLALALLTGAFGLLGQEEYVVAPGILRVYAYDVTDGINAEDMTKNELTNSVTIRYREYSAWSPIINVLCQGIPFYLEVPEGYFGDAEVTFELCADLGQFWIYNEDIDIRDTESSWVTYLGNTVTIGNKEHIYWEGYGGCRIPLPDEGNFVFFADILIRADGQIAGYGVIEFYYDDDDWMCIAFNCTTYCFPMIDGQLQDVSEEYVSEQIAKIKANSTLPAGWEVGAN